MLVNEDLTYQDIANRFDVSCATVFKDMQMRLPNLDENLYKQVHVVAERHRFESAERAVKARKTKRDYIKKNFDLSIFDK